MDTNEIPEDKILILSLTDQLTFIFVHVPDGFTCKGFKLTDHQVTKLGKLSSFNRIKLLTKWKKTCKDLVKHFSNGI